MSNLPAHRLRVVNISPAVFDFGIEEHRVEGQTVRVYNLARTVADCFRFRNKIGLTWRSKRLKVDGLSRIVQKLRVQGVMQPYLETVVLCGPLAAGTSPRPLQVRGT